MNIPGFTADASLHPARRLYQMVQVPAQAGGIVRPAYFDNACYIGCRDTCSCLDLQGAARGACFRACHTDCLADCTS
jgi:hypothetical protein